MGRMMAGDDILNLKAWWLKRRRTLIFGLCAALVLVAAVYALAYVQAWRQFQDGRIYYHHRFYDLSTASAAAEDMRPLMQDMQPTGTVIFGEEVYDLPPSAMTSMAILLKSKDDTFHMYTLVGGP